MVNLDVAEFAVMNRGRNQLGPGCGTKPGSGCIDVFGNGLLLRWRILAISQSVLPLATSVTHSL